MRLRCLIVDDNDGFRHEMSALLEEQGISVVGGAASGAEALAMTAELRPDVVLVDIDLGGENGLELAERLRHLPGRAGAPNVILISGHDESEYADLIDSSPALGFIAKTDLSAAAIRRLLPSGDD